MGSFIIFIFLSLISVKQRLFIFSVSINSKDASTANSYRLACPERAYDIKKSALFCTGADLHFTAVLIHA